jgi:Polyketide cyclase / dehydrase and lipid transport
MLGLGTVETDASAAEVWSLIARPDRWHEWSPYVAGAEGLGTPEVEAGAEGAVVLRGGVRIGAEILEVVPGQSWTWRVKGLRIRHKVEPTPSGARLTMAPSGSGPLWGPLAIAYRVPTALIARNISRVSSKS